MSVLFVQFAALGAAAESEDLDVWWRMASRLSGISLFVWLESRS